METSRALGGRRLDPTHVSLVLRTPHFLSFAPIVCIYSARGQVLHLRYRIKHWRNEHTIFTPDFNVMTGLA
jgi:hypothetical protein